MISENNDTLRNSLNELLSLLNQSHDSVIADTTVREIKDIINEAVNDIDHHRKVNINALRDLLLPTASLQDISIDNGWGGEFCTIADEIEKLI